VPTTNHTSRAPKRQTRAALSQFTFGDFDRISENFAPLRPLGRPGGMAISTATRIAVSTAAIASTAQPNPSVASSAAPIRKPRPFTAFFDPVRIATQRKSPPCAVGARILTADFEDILARSLATPDAPWTAIT